MIAFPNNNVTLVQPSGDVQTVNLSEYTANKAVILYFYPKDNTAGCTVQALDFSQKIDDFAALGYAVIGISRDSIKSHQNFIAKHNLSITLISDSDEHLCRHFDVIKPKQMYGKTHLGVVRSTFVFDSNHQLLHALTNVKAKTHIEQLLDLLTH